MKRIIITLILFSSLILASAALGADGVKLGCVDIQKILLNSDAGKASQGTACRSRPISMKGRKTAGKKN